MTAVYQPTRDADLEVKVCDCGRPTQACDAVCHVCACEAWLSDLRAEMAAAERQREERAAVVDAMHRGLRHMLFAGIVKGGSR